MEREPERQWKSPQAWWEYIKKRNTYCMNPNSPAWCKDKQEMGWKRSSYDYQLPLLSQQSALPVVLLSTLGIKSLTRNVSVDFSEGHQTKKRSPQEHMFVLAPANVLHSTPVKAPHLTVWVEMWKRKPKIKQNAIIISISTFDSTAHATFPCRAGS